MIPASAQRSLAGHVAIVTGASSGIGWAVTAELAMRGIKVLGVGRNDDRLDALAAKTGAATLAISLSEWGAGARAMEAAAKLGAATILVHSAGRGGYLDKPIFEQPYPEWRETMAVNLDSAFELAQLVARQIRQAGWGRIVMLGSTAGEIGAPSMAPYCASKQGLIGLVRSVAHDVAPHNGTCNAVLPSWVRTEMADQDAKLEAARRCMSPEAVWDERAAQNPRGRIVTAEEVAAAVCFLASPEASGINGQAINVSAGSAW